eukprot:6459904-Amphidinium_carterae.2
MADWQQQASRGRWHCSACGQDGNWKKRDTCRACGNPKPQLPGTPLPKGNGKGKGQSQGAGSAELAKMMAQVLQRQQQLDAKVGQLSKGPPTPSTLEPKMLFEDSPATQASAGEDENKAEAEKIRGELAELRRILGNDHSEVVRRDQRLMELARLRGPGAERLRVHNCQQTGEVGEAVGAH